MGNTIFAINVDIFKLWDSLEPHYKSAVYNGVLCDVTDQVSFIRLYEIDSVDITPGKFLPGIRERGESGKSVRIVSKKTIIA